MRHCHALGNLRQGVQVFLFLRCRMYPYHLADYTHRVMRVSAFQYYCDILYDHLVAERSYDKLPNFTAADALR